MSAGYPDAVILETALAGRPSTSAPTAPTPPSRSGTSPALAHETHVEVSITARTSAPQRESTLLWPRFPYGVAKVFGHHMTIN